MPHPMRVPTIAKFAAVASSIVLVGLYIVYRSGGQTARVFPSSKLATVRLTASTNPTSAPATAPFVIQEGANPLIGSSKGGVVFTPSTFSGSKSAAVFTPADQPILYDDNGPTAARTVPAAPAPATTQAATKPTLVYPATTQSSAAIGAGFKLSNSIGAEFAVAADICVSPATQPAKP